MKCLPTTLRPATAGLVLALLAPTGTLHRAQAADIAIVTASDAAPAERIAAADLATALQKIYPREHFAPAADLPAAGKAILVGRATSAMVRRHIGEAGPTAPESYIVRRTADGPREIGIVTGADPRGTAYGVYALLEKLGCAFTISGDALPPPRETAFNFDAWQLADRPLTRQRLVFDWHNFLSGCSTWNFPDWQRWTAQSQKMGFNAIMVHAYGNNPMAGFAFDGAAKPVGYLSTTIKGRDWATMHVNDVRRLFGGEVFDAPAFGADAGFAPDAERVPAAQALMRSVFADAAQRAMGVYFAVDVDTPSANPPELVLRLPESARFNVGGATATMAAAAPSKIWLPNPDTPEGHAYFRAQVEGLIKAYPQITHLVVWFRRGGTPWMELKPANLPPAWQKEYAAEIERTPEAGHYWHAPGLFAVGKIVRAFDRALKETGAGGVQLAAGTWGFEFLPGADRFFPAGVPLLGLDYEVLHDKPQLGDAASRAPLREIGARRPLIPIVWAHHDDGHYIGRPYTPFPEFASKLDDARAAGFGIIHWTTRPLDLYFSSLAKQVWSRTRDRSLRETCRDLATAWFGMENRELLGGYLESWIKDAPRFGRETTNWFIDRKLTEIPQVVAGCRARQAKIDAARTAGLTPEQRARLAYYRGLEEFIAAIHEAHGRLQDSQDLLLRGDRAGARRALAACQPEAVIEQFARFSAIGGMTRGEQGLVVTMNTRWLSHIVRHRQALGLEAVRINFAPTSHDPLAQHPGTFTFHFDAEHALWVCWGAKETGAEVFVLPADTKIERGDLPAAWEEVGRTGIISSRPLTLALRPIMALDSRGRGKPAPLPAGDYRLRLLFVEPEAKAPGERVFDLAVRVSAAGADAAFTPLEQIDIAKLAGGRNRLVERVHSIRIEPLGAGEIQLRITPVHGQALLCGTRLEPVASP